jgi:ABC-type transport system involved in multi-copper enzyme maturation permease subunit
MLIATMAYAAGDSAAYFLYSDWAATAMAVLVVVAAFLAAIPAAMSIAVEKEQRTLEMVVATLLRPHTILWGKLAAAFWQAQPLVLLAVPLGVLCAAVDVVPWRSAAYMLLCAETFALATCAVGVFVSLLARRPARAVSVTACIVAGLAIGPILLLRLGISHLAGLADPGRSLWVGPLGVLQAVFAQPAQRWQLATDAVIGAFAIALLAFLAALALFRTTVRRAIESA